MSKAKTSSSKLDPMPTTLVKTCLPVICPFIAAIINCSLDSGEVPSGFKIAAVIPNLLKSGLDPDDPNNYRPISNLPFLSKILERAVASQLNMSSLNPSNQASEFDTVLRPPSLKSPPTFLMPPTMASSPFSSSSISLQPLTQCPIPSSLPVSLSSSASGAQLSPGFHPTFSTANNMSP